MESLKLFRALVVLCAVFGNAGGSFAQSTAINPYANLVGTWSGYDEVHREGKLLRIPVHLAITEEKHDHRMRFEYVYSERGKKDFDKETKFLTFDPLREAVTLQFQGESSQVYQTKGLAEFARNGNGEFFLLPKQSTHAMVPEYSRAAFELRSETFRYSWQLSRDGTHWETTSVFTLVRAQ